MTCFVPYAAVQTARQHLIYTVWSGPKLPFLIPPWTPVLLPLIFSFNHSMPLLLLAPTPTRSGQQDKWKERLLVLRVLNINFKSFSAKRAETPNLLESLKPDIILETETWLDPTTATAETLPDSYKVYGRDRGGRGGGVLIAVRNSLDSYAAPDLEVDDCELLWVRIRLRGRRTLYVCCWRMLLPHLLVQKLLNMKLTSSVISWIFDYLTSRPVCKL